MRIFYQLACLERRSLGAYKQDPCHQVKQSSKIYFKKGHEIIYFFAHLFINSEKIIRNSDNDSFIANGNKLAARLHQ